VPPVRWRAGFLVGVLVLAGAMALPAGASAQSPTITESFSPGSFPLGDTTTLTFTISNPDASVHSVNFDDTLPAGMQLVTGSQTTTCALPAVVMSGNSRDLSFTDPVLADTSCTVSASLQGVQPGFWDNSVDVSIDANPPTPIDASIDVVAPPSLSVAFAQSPLGLDGTTPLSFTITNPNPSFALSGVAFTDTLPAGLVIIGQPGDTCGGAVTAVAGTDSIGLSDGQLSPGSSCTVSALVAATIIGALSDTTTQVLSTEGGMGNTASASLTVVGPPVILLSAPASGQYQFGQAVRALYSCTDPSGPGIASCAGTVPSGSLIDTSKAGPHTFTVTATSKDGGVAGDIAFYTVAPDNRFTVAKPRIHSGGSVGYSLKLPGPGRITVLETVAGSRTVFARGSAVARRAGTVRFTLKPSARGRQALRQKHALRLTVTVGYTPTRGTQRTARLQLRVA
jgi:uncharacterized repeat protein (TIGR01451 family)